MPRQRAGPQLIFSMESLISFKVPLGRRTLGPPGLNDVTPCVFLSPIEAKSSSKRNALERKCGTEEGLWSLSSMAAGELKWKLEFGFGLLFDGCNRTGELDWEFEYGLEFEGGWGIGELK